MSRRPLFVKSSDWHLQPGAWKRANTPKGDAFFALQQLYRFCSEHECDLLGAGDLFDDLQPDTATLEKAFQFVDSMKARDRRIYFTQGQHEKAYPPYLSLHPHPRHVHRKVVTVGGLSVYGFDHVPADQLEAEILRVPKGVDLVMCHQVWNDFMGLGFEGQLQTLIDRQPGAVLTGDFHEHQVLTFGDVRVYSPGSTCLQDIKEPEEKAFFVFYDDGSVDSVPLLTRPKWNFRITCPDDVEALFATMDAWFLPYGELPPELQKPVFSIECGAVPEAYKRVTRAVGDRAFLFWKSVVAPAGDTLYDQAEADRAAPRGLEGCLPLVTPAGGAVYNSVLRLLRAKDKKTELAAMAGEFGR